MQKQPTRYWAVLIMEVNMGCATSPTGSGLRISKFVPQEPWSSHRAFGVNLLVFKREEWGIGGPVPDLGCQKSSEVS